MGKNSVRFRLKSNWDEGRFEQVLKKIEEKSSVNAKGAMSWSDWSIDIYFSVAIEAFKEIPGVPKREFNKALRRAIMDCRTSQKLTYQQVIKAAQANLAVFRRKPVSQFAILIDIDLELPHGTGAKRFTFGDVSLEVTRKLPKYMVGEHLRDVSKTPYGDAPARRFSWLIARCDARTEHEAASLGFEASAVFINLSNLITKSWNIFGGEQRPVALFTEGPYQYIFENRSLVSNQWYNPNFREEYWRSNLNDGGKFFKATKTIRLALNKLAVHPLFYVLSSALAMMGNGMESHKLDDRTLHYWTAIERLFSREGEKVPYEKIIKRATFLEQDKSEARMFLSHLASLRNERVHHGKSANHHHQVLEYSADLVARFCFYLIFHGDDFADHAEFLEMAELPADRAALKRRQVAIERRIRFIEKRRHREDR